MWEKIHRENNVYCAAKPNPSPQVTENISVEFFKIKKQVDEVILKLWGLADRTACCQNKGS